MITSCVTFTIWCRRIDCEHHFRKGNKWDEDRLLETLLHVLETDEHGTSCSQWWHFGKKYINWWYGNELTVVSNNEKCMNRNLMVVVIGQIPSVGFNDFTTVSDRETSQLTLCIRWLWLVFMASTSSYPHARDLTTSPGQVTNGGFRRLAI